MSESTTVVAVHSLGLDGTSFAPLADRLCDWSFLTPDLRGHGSRRDVSPVTLTAMAGDVLELMAHESGPVHLLGHSIGGVVAGMAAAARPDLTASLTIVASPPQGFAAFAERADAAERDGMDRQIDETLARWFGPDASAEAPAVVTARAALGRMTTAGWAASWRTFAGFEGFAALHPDAALGARTLCLSTWDDLSTPPEAVAAVADAFPGARHVTLDAGGHLGLIEHPVDVADLLATHWHAWQPLVPSATSILTTDRNDS